MAIKLVTPPTTEPVTLAEAKAHLRVDVADDDALITNHITAARMQAESICRRVFVTTGFELYLDGFPSFNYNNTITGYLPQEQAGWGALRAYNVRFRGRRIDLPFPTLQAVSSVKYYNTAGPLITLDPSVYLVDAISEPGCLVPAPNMNWPDTQSRLNAVQISFTAGYGNASAVPAGIKAWILLMVGSMYENRESEFVASGKHVIPMFADRLLDQFKIASYV